LSLGIIKFPLFSKSSIITLNWTVIAYSSMRD
jgi:hypothetical protein